MFKIFSVFFACLCAVHAQNGGSPLEPYPQPGGDHVPLAPFPDQTYGLSRPYQTEQGGRYIY